MITAGAAQRHGETRLQLLEKNAAIVRSIVGEVVEQKSRGVMLIATNPVDIRNQNLSESEQPCWN